MPSAQQTETAHSLPAPQLLTPATTLATLLPQRRVAQVLQMAAWIGSLVSRALAR
jgi:hypothetical protein